MIKQIEKWLLDLLVRRAIASGQLKPLGHAKWWARQNYCGHGEIDYNEGFEFCKKHEVGDDGIIAQPVYLLNDLPPPEQNK